NFARDNHFNVTTGITPSGAMTYEAAVKWVAQLKAHDPYQRDWQLPTTPSVDSTCAFYGKFNGHDFGPFCQESALGSLYYMGLGLLYYDDAVPVNDQIGPFTNLQPTLYWSGVVRNGTSTQKSTTGVETFSFSTGVQFTNTRPNYLNVLPMVQGLISSRIC